LILDFQEIPSKSSPKKTVSWVRARCDFCQSIFERKYSKARRTRDLEFHFCSRECCASASKVGDIIHAKKRKRCLDQHGVEHTSILLAVQAKQKATMIERWGVEHNIHLSGAVDTFVSASMTYEAKEKRQATTLERYGVKCFFQTKAIRQHNSMWVSSEEFKDKVKLAKTESGLSSKAENCFGVWLRESFPTSNIEEQVVINKWIIDFQIDDVYVNFDGVYWHGLDRPIEEIAKFRNIRDKRIYHGYFDDRFQDEWFKRQGLTLVRVTDIEHRDEPEVVLKRIKDAIWSKL